MKDEKFVKASEDAYYSLNLSEFPNFHQSGNIEGMRARYYGKDAYLAQAGNFIYHVDEDTFHAIKNYDFIRQQPEWLQEVSKTLADSKIQKQASLYIGSPHSQTVISLSIQTDIIRKMLGQIDKSVTEARLAGPNAVGEMYVSCKFNGEHKLISLTQNDKKSLLDLMTDERDARIKMIAARELAEPLFNSVGKEVENNQEKTSVSTSNAMDDDHIHLTADKISAVLEKFYSLHEADELTRIIMNPESDVEEVKVYMERIRQQKINDEMLEHITDAWLTPSSDGKVLITATIDNWLMRSKELNETDARDMSSVDRELLTEAEFKDMVKDLALSYYKDELSQKGNQEQVIPEEQQTVTKEDLRTFNDLEKALQQKFPHGLILNIPDLTVDDIHSYIQFGHFRSEDFKFAGVGELIPESEYLKTDVRLSNKELTKLHPDMDAYYDEEYQYFINDLDAADVYHAETSELMHNHPDLMGAKFSMYGNEPAKYMHIEGNPLSSSIAWVLQKPTITTQELKDVLRYPDRAQAILDELKSTEPLEYDKNRIAKMNLPEGLDMKYNDNKMYFFQRGILGYAEVDRMRGVTYKDETMCREALDYINNFVSNNNLKVKNKTFFSTPGINSEKRAYLDTMKDKLVKIDIEKDIYGRTLYTSGTAVMSEGDMLHLQDITGRVTNANIFGMDKPMVRCKIDGEQQSGRPLTKSDIIRMGSFMSNSEAMKGFALSMAVKYFATDLYDNREQQQSKGMGR